MDGIGLALFGLGRAGKIHFQSLVRNLRIDLKYLVEMNESLAAQMVSDYRLVDTRVVTPKDIDIVLKDSSVKACVIATPTETHKDLVMACLSAKKAVFCEKPLADSVEAIEKCYEKARVENLPLLCSFNRRFDPGVRTIQKRVQSGDVGRVHMVKMTSRDSPLPPMSYLKTSNGIYHDCAVHDVDIISWIFGEKPVTVYTTAHSFIKEIGEINDVDTLAIVLTFPSGGIGMVDISRYCSFGYDQRLEVFGDKGMLQQHNVKENSIEFSGLHGSSTARAFHSFPQRYAESYIEIMEHFLDIIQGKCIAEITQESTLVSCDIITACLQSLSSGQAVHVK